MAKKWDGDRTLDDDIPELLPYLTPGIQVLDVVKSKKSCICILANIKLNIACCFSCQYSTG